MATITWTGAAGDGNYNNALNWSPPQVPTVADTVTISESAATAINASGGAALSLTISKAVTLNVSNQTDFTFGSGSSTSTFSNAGTLALNSTNQATELVIGGKQLTLSGGGVIALSNNGGNEITGAAAGDKLINSNNTIEGGGQIGAGTLTLINNAGGTIDADTGTALVINTGTATVTNAGLLKSTSTGGLVLQSVVSDGSTGKITAAGGNVYLQGADIEGGTFASSGGAAITVQGGYSATLDGTANAITNTGTFAVNNQGTVSVLGSITNSGIIALQSTNQATEFVVGPASGAPGTVSLSGAGTLLLSDNGGNYIFGAQAGDTLVNTSTIAGAGQFGDGTLTLINHGTIDATGGNGLVINTGSTVTNSALLEATNPVGGLVLQSTINDSTGGTVLAAGANVYLQGADIVGGLVSSTGAGAIVIQGGQSATLDGSTQTVTNTNQFDVNNQGVLDVLGTLTNTGTISLQSTNQATEFVANTATVTLTGGGVLALSDNQNNYIFGATTATVLDNVNNTIEGSGQIGDNQLTLINSGTISATGTGSALYINGDTLVTNTGLMQALGANGLVFQNTTVQDGTTGTISAVTSNVFLQNTTIEGGLLKTATTQAIEIQGGQGATLDGSAHTVTSSGNIQVDNQGSLTVLGTLTNTGTIALNSTNQATEFVIGGPAVTLNGGGTINLSNNGNNYIFGSAAADTLDNVNNTIAGAGQFGDGQLTLVNALHGTINADQGTSLVLNTGTIAVSNAGLIESTSTGGLVISGTNVANTGTILANGGNVYLSAGGEISGGLLSGLAGGIFEVTNATTGTLNGASATLTLASNLDVTNQSSLSLLGTILNQQTLALQSTNQYTDLIVGPATGTPGTVTLSGGGTLSLSDNGGNRIYGAQAADTLVNANNLIEGAGQLGAAQLTFINDSVVDATGGNGLVVNTASITAINNDLMEATNPSGGLVIQTAVDSSGGGTILAAGGNVYLDGGTLIGGTINSSGGADLVVRNSNNGTLNGSGQAVTNLGGIAVTNQSTLTALGSLVNKGTIALQSTNQNTDFIVGSPTLTLSGAGTITLSDNGGNRIYGAVGTDELNNVNNTIAGAGQLGAGQLTLVNEASGIIDGTGGNALVINTGGITAINDGLIEATNSGGVVVQTAIDSSGGGTLLASGGNIYLDGGTLLGGTLNSTSGSALVVRNSNNGTLNGAAHTLTNHGSIAVTNQSTLTVLGTLANSGTIALQSTNQNTDLIINSPTLTLTGGGTVTLSDNGGNRIYGAATADVLDNVNNTIEGSGQLGAGQLTLINGGTIAATGGNALDIYLNSTGTNTATGQMLGEGSGGLVFQTGTYTNSGLIQADNGSSVTFQSGAILTNDSAKGTLTGGTYGAVSTGNDATASFTGAAVTTLDAALILSGAGSEISFGGTVIESSLKTIGLKGSLSVLDDRGYTTKVKLTNSGTIALGGGTFKDGSVVNKGTISGFGTLAAKLTDTGSIVASGGELVLAGAANSVGGTLSGTGTLAFSKGATTLASGTALDVSTIALINAATLNLSGAVSFGGTFDISGNGTLAGPGGFTNTGLFEQTGKGLGSVSAPFTNDGTISIVSGGTLAFTGGLANGGSILDNGVFTDNAVLTGGNLTVGGSAASATLGTGSSTVDTLTLGGGTLNTGGTLTVTGDYDNTAAGAGNSYMPFAGVIGTIDGQGTQMSVMGVNGTTITSVDGTLTIMVAAHGSASFVIENTGAAGSAALRGALETTVNGGTINGHALSGSGVTAQNFGPITAGSSSGTFTITDKGGSFSNEAIHLQSDFANVAGITIDIVQQPAGATAPAALSSLPEYHASALNWLPAFHHL